MINKTVNLNGQKTKVKFSYSTDSEWINEGNVLDYNIVTASGTSKEVKRMTTNSLSYCAAVFTINGKKYEGQFLYKKSLRRSGLCSNSFFVYNGVEFKTEKKLIEYILS